jgi:hypothetical protein
METTWQDLCANSVYPHGAPSRVACHERTEYSAAVADPRAQLPELAERIAKRAGYPEADAECMSIARRMFKEVASIDRLLAAYDRLEKSPKDEKTFFVKIAAESDPGWQIRRVVAEAKRGERKRAAWYAGNEEFVNR